VFVLIKGRFLIEGINEIGPALEIRREVFEKELGLTRVQNEDGLDTLAVHGIVFDGQQPVASGRMIYLSGRYLMDRVCVLSDHRRQYKGDFLVRMMCDRAFNSGATEVWLALPCELLGLAKNIGFEDSGETQEFADRVLHLMKLPKDKFISKCGHSCCH